MELEAQSVKVGTEEIVVIQSNSKDLSYQWKNGWGEWQEFQNCAELAELKKKALDALQRGGSKGKGKDKGKVFS